MDELLTKDKNLHSKIFKAFLSKFSGKTSVTVIFDEYSFVPTD